MIQSRRGFLGGLAALAVAAPAIIRTPGLLMPVRQMLPAGLLDPQKMYSYWPDTTVEYTALLPKHLFTLDEFSERILAPMVEQMQQRFVYTIMHGTDRPTIDLSSLLGEL